MADQGTRQWLAAMHAHNRHHDHQVLARVDLQQPPPDLGDWPPVAQPGTVPVEEARRLKHLLWCDTVGGWVDTRTSTCGHNKTAGAP